MATLVLTAAGTALGGPIGGAIGAFLGQQVDQNILFKTKGREGPRLQELAVQTSSYGSQIPRIYGKMRVAGTVIWATDLKETRNSQGGSKGRPKTSTYSYSACFAVALSSRYAERIGRIWADGKIFRGQAGDFKTTTGFRFYNGSEDQIVDSLISSAEGVMQSPAYRGIALAVFEDMDLTEYGNRIPSLTFEVIAEDGTITIGDIISDIAMQIDASAIEDNVIGFAASGSDRGNVLDVINNSYSLSYGVSEIAISAKPAENSDIMSIVDISSSIAFAENGKLLEKPEYQTLPETRIARQYALRYYDPSRDYQSGMQNSFRPGLSRVIASQDFPSAITADTAKRLAYAKLLSIYRERCTAKIHILQNANDIHPGSLVKIDETPDIWRVKSLEYQSGTIALSLSKSGNRQIINGESDQGRVVSDVDALAGETRLFLVDLPFAIDAPLAASDKPRLYAAAAGGTGWRNAQLFKTDVAGSGNTLIGQVKAPSIIGTVEGLADTGSTNIFDLSSHVIVQLHNEQMDLQDADNDQLFKGANIAAIGEEILQFGSVQPLGNKRFRLSRLIRGLGGSEHHVGGHVAGETFLLLDQDSLAEIEPQYYTAFQAIQISALGRDDIIPAIASIERPGRALRPWSPVHEKFAFNDNGDLEISWTRRSRAGLIWLDNVGTPLAEESEQYDLQIMGPDRQLLSSFQSHGSSYLIPKAQIQIYYSAGYSEITFSVRQAGQFAASEALKFTVPL